MLKIMTEASGSLTTGYLIKAIRDAGYLPVASDIDPACVGRYLADDFILMPAAEDPELWDRVLSALERHRINVVLPSLDETLAGWAVRKQELAGRGIHVIVSDAATVQTCQDKWLTYQFFRDNGIPTPQTSLNQDFPLIKPRLGRGAVGVRVASELVNMDGMLSQEYLSGVEYTVDVFCDNQGNPIYIIPRKRLKVREGKSTAGVVVHQPEIEYWVTRICKLLPFYGPINLQCFMLADGSVRFIEINPRIAGGMALGFAASENWIRLAIDNLTCGKPIIPKPICYGMEMRRYYAEVFVSPD